MAGVDLFQQDVARFARIDNFEQAAGRRLRRTGLKIPKQIHATTGVKVSGVSDRTPSVTPQQTSAGVVGGDGLCAATQGVDESP